MTQVRCYFFKSAIVHINSGRLSVLIRTIKCSGGNNIIASVEQ
ncbi:hypothetical protein ACFP3I_11940 [Chryseobacterium arachidis]